MCCCCDAVQTLVARQSDQLLAQIDGSNCLFVSAIQRSDPAWVGNGLEMRTSSGEWWKQRFTVILSGLSMNSGDMVCQATFAIPCATVYLILHATLFMLSSWKGYHSFTVAVNVKAYHNKKKMRRWCTICWMQMKPLGWLRYVFYYIWSTDYKTVTVRFD